MLFDAVLHHGAAKDNSLWNYDGWEVDGNGGIYHEGGHQTGFGVTFSFWKDEVKQMLYDSCAMYFRYMGCTMCSMSVWSLQNIPFDSQASPRWEMVIVASSQCCFSQFAGSTTPMACALTLRNFYQSHSPNT